MLLFNYKYLGPCALSAGERRVFFYASLVIVILRAFGRTLLEASLGEVSVAARPQGHGAVYGGGFDATRQCFSPLSGVSER